MDDRKIEVILSALRTGSFSKAADELNCTQSAVTQTINAFERELDCKILERNHNGVYLSEMGEKLLPFIIDAHKSLDALKQQAKFMSLNKQVPIRIGTFSSISNTWLSKILMAYQEKNPEVVFDIRIGTDSLAEWLLNGEIDLALGDSERLRAFRWFNLMEDPYYAVAPRHMFSEKQKTITHQELFSMPFIMASSNAIDKYFSHVPQKEIKVKCDNDSTLLSMVEQGLGVTAMPKLSLYRQSYDVHTLALEPSVQRHLGIALPNHFTKMSLDFANFLIEHRDMI